MKIAVIEHFTSLPPGTAPSGLVAQGRAMRDACGADLARRPGVEVVIAGTRRAFVAALRLCDAALVIAPRRTETSRVSVTRWSAAVACCSARRRRRCGWSPT